MGKIKTAPPPLNHQTTPSLPLPPQMMSRAHDGRLPHDLCLRQLESLPSQIGTHPALTMLNSQTPSMSVGFRKLPRSSSIRWLRRSFLHTPKMTTSVRRIRKELSQAPSDGCQPIPAHWHSGNDQRRWKHTILTQGMRTRRMLQNQGEEQRETEWKKKAKLHQMAAELIPANRHSSNDNTR